ncbi:lipopolysaccharide-induced tumor necrosis factor-alpha factor homolog [Drosophila bipectinata]|uniref:lipopolysaccharide-induced tumor necrosis factor-alpha factor homolog n=1 Tax=Drosophila bipectinata TaxID=42026 RepID=UPI001C898072|nr:lipopolysaccharide-induced tumor necrosis factor-alpha factor homolog [Drosophila bipectinata]
MDYQRVGEASPPSYSEASPSAPPPEMDMVHCDSMPAKHLYPPVPPYQQVTPYQPVPQMPPPPPQAPVPVPVNVVHHTTTVLVDNPGQGMICPKCSARIRVRTEHHATGKTYCLAALLCLCFCWPCVCVPCCCNCCYKTSQFCPNCNACLGTF